MSVRKNIDAVRNAEYFGGGIRSVGSNARDAGLIMDGDPATSWSPDPADGIENAYIELDLGRLVDGFRARHHFRQIRAAL